MQRVTPRLIEAYESLSDHKVAVKVDEGDDYFRIEAGLDKATAIGLDSARLESATAIVPPELQKVHFDISALDSYAVKLTEASWRESLRKYIDDARVLEEPWNARVTATLDKKAVIGKTHLDTANFDVVPIFMSATLLDKRRLPLTEQLHLLSRSHDKKTVFVMLDLEVFLDGPFVCFTDWNRIGSVTFSQEPFSKAAKRIEMIQQECSWQGLERVYLPEFLEFTSTNHNSQEVMAWMESLRGTLSLFAIANATAIESKKTKLTFWGMRKRQVVLNGAGIGDRATSESSRALYSWVYREVPHPNAALRIARNSVAQFLGPNPEGNAQVLGNNLADIMSSAKANYAAFVQEKLDDFFELRKEISNYTNSAAEYLYKTVGDLNASVRKSVFATLGVIAGALVSTTAVQLNPMAYTSILIAYGGFLLLFNVYYLPRTATAEFFDHLRRFRKQLEPYRDFLNDEQIRQVFEEVPFQNEMTFTKTRRLLRVVNVVLAGLVLSLSGFDVPNIAKSFRFLPTWSLGRAIEWLMTHASRLL